MKKILIVDDEEVLINLLSKRFEAAGYEIVSAKDGESGLQKAREFQPDLIVLDIVLPHIDGFTFIQQKKVDDVIKDIPVFILTAKAHLIELFRAEGIEHYMTKPFDTQQLLSEVEGIIGKGEPGPDVKS